MKAETILSLNGKKCVLIYDWDAICLLEKKFTPENLTQVLASQDIVHLADVMECGFARHNPELTAEVIFNMSPPIVECRKAVEKALSLAYFGTENPQITQDGDVKKKTKVAKFLMLIVTPFILGWILSVFGILPHISFQF